MSQSNPIGRVFGPDRWGGRTRRFLQAHGVSTAPGKGAVWFLRAGAWSATEPRICFPRSSATGRPLCALGAATNDALWQQALEATGGVFDATWLSRVPIHSVYVEEPLVTRMDRALEENLPFEQALRGVCERDQEMARIVHVPALDVDYSSELRVAEVVTSLQIGGAEKLVVSLAEHLGRAGVGVCIFTIGAPMRSTVATCAPVVDLSSLRGDRGAQGVALGRAVSSFGADVVHGHLLDSQELSVLSKSGHAVVGTLHNAQFAWPPGMETMGASDVSLLVACAKHVEAELRRARVVIPTRTVWNGIEPVSRSSLEKRKRWREAHGISDEDMVLVTVANARPQKRLEWLAEVGCRLREALAPRSVRLVLVGAVGGTSPAAQDAERSLAEALEQWPCTVLRTGLLDRVDDVLAASDVLVSPSAYEGLSLAQLEALDAGLPVVCCTSDGPREIAACHEGVTLVEERLGPAGLADAVRGLKKVQVPFPSRFRASPMAQRYRHLLERAVATHRVLPGDNRGEGLVLVTNNFSIGGAQSSARRLLCALAKEGVSVSAVVLEEQPAYASPGRRALQEAGVQVFAASPPEDSTLGDALRSIFAWVDARRPESVVFWNARPEYKTHLADGLWGVRVFDVSPGEMYFSSLARYFTRGPDSFPVESATDYGALLAGVVVKYEAERSAALALGAPVHVIPNGVELGAERPGLRRTQVVFGTLARLSPQKKLEEALLAFRKVYERIPHSVFRIAGGVEGNNQAYCDELRQLARGLPVEFVGEQLEPREFLRDLDVFVMISEPAGCPNASLEAMAEGLAVVLTDTGGAGEQVEDGVSGVLVARGDASALAEGLVALGGDAELRDRMGRAARLRIAERFSLRRMLASYRRVLLR